MSVYLPVRLLRETRTSKFVADYAARYQVSTSRICFELSEKLLMENDEQIPNSIQSMRNLGFHFMLTNFGGSSCPMMRLSNYPVDYVMLSPEVANYIGRGERSDNAVKSIISFVNDIGSEPVADGVFNSHQAEMLYSFECSYCAGSLSGKYMTERYVRRRSDS
jgi:EAL domain-containing protein (putative c-di-GMP-specific phosphodiesterase class I)